jgi:hypothetical protein
MLLVDDILFFPARSIMWIFREITKIAQEELAGEAKSITEQLRMLYMQLETGRITEAEFETGEKRLLDRLEAIESRRSDEDSGEDEAETEEPDEDETEEADEDEESDEDGAEEFDEDGDEESDDAGRDPDER